MLTKQALAVILVLFLAVPAWANAIVVGSVSRSQAATVRGTDLTPGHTIFSDDTIVVGMHGSAWIALTGGAQVQLGENSQVRLSKTTDNVQLTIDRGLASFRTAENSEFAAFLGDATIRSANGMPAVGIISVRNPQSAIIAAKKGALLVSTARDSKSVTLREGEGVDVTLVPRASNTRTAMLGGAVAASGALLGPTLLIPGGNGGGCSDDSPPPPVSRHRGRGHCEE